MKRHPAWLAAGLLLFAVLACNLSKNKNTSTSNDRSSDPANDRPTVNRPANADVYVDQIQMAKDDRGKAGASTTSFDASEHTVHVVITLNKAKAGTQLRAIWLAADVEGMPKNRELKSVDYTTKSFDKKIPGYLTWSQDWPKGQYKVEVYINGALDKVLTYSVE